MYIEIGLSVHFTPIVEVLNRKSTVVTHLFCANFKVKITNQFLHIYKCVHMEVLLLIEVVLIEDHSMMPLTRQC